MTQLLKILVLENDTDSVLFLNTTLSLLKDKDIESLLYITSNLEEALKALTKKNYDLIITNLYLPDSQGIKTLIEIQKKTESTPIIILGELEDEEIARKAIRLGAQDYVPKTEIEAGYLSRVINYAIERQKLHDSLKALSFTDELTGLYNRRGFMTLLEQQMMIAKRIKKGFYLFLIDVDYLKQINDSFGHLAGDQSLINTAHCLNSSFRHYDVISRIGGDEFGIIAINADIGSLDHFIRIMMNKLDEFNAQSDAPYKLSFGIGKTYFDGIEDLSIEALLQSADHDLYTQKSLTHKEKRS